MSRATMLRLHEVRIRTALTAAAAGFTAPIAVLNVYGGLSGGFANATRSDAAVYYAAATVGLRFGWSQLYDAAKQAIVWPELHVYQTAWVVQTPIVAWLFAPLTVLSLQAAYDLWAASVVVMIGVAWSLLAAGDVRSRIAQLAAVLALWGVGIGIAVGQLVFLVGACVALAWWLLERDRPVLAGVALAVAFGLKPQSASLVPFALLLAGYRKTFVAWAAGVALLAVAVIAVLGLGGTLDFVLRLRDVSTRPAAWNSVPGMTFAGLLGTGPAAVALQLASGAGSLWIAYRKRGAGPALPVASAIVGSSLLTPYLHEPDVFMLVIAAWLFVRSRPGALPALYPIAMWIAAEVAHIPAVGYAPLLVLEVLWLVVMLRREVDTAGLPRRTQPATAQ